MKNKNNKNQNLIEKLNSHSDSIWGEGFEAIARLFKPKQKVKLVHMSDLWKEINE